MPALDALLTERLQKAAEASRHRTLREVATHDASGITVQGQRLLSFSSNDYLGLSRHSQVIEAAQKAAEQYGAGAGASRLVTGNHPLYTLLEKQLAAFKGTEAACVFGSGYLANMGVITALMNKDDLIIADKLSHACLLDGAMLSGARLLRFHHNDTAHLQILLEKERANYKNCLVITEGIFSMDGDSAPLDEISTITHAHEAWLMVDDAHGLGVLGEGRGTAASFTYKPLIDIETGTFSKAAGSYGGYACGSQVLIDYMHNAARSLIFSTGLPPYTIAASIEALSLMQRDKSLIEKPLQMARKFTQALQLPRAQSAIVPYVVGAEKEALALSQYLEEHGFAVIAIRPPTVPPGTARLRFAFNALHGEEDVLRLADLVRNYQKHKAA